VLVAALFAMVALSSQANEKRTVEIAIGATPVTVDVHLASPVATPRGGVVLAHGMLRSRETLAEFARELATRDLVAVVPDLPAIADARANAQALRETVAALRSGKFSSPVDRVVLVGFSMGGLASLLAADAPGVVGWVGLDPVDLPDRRGLEAARVLQIPAVLVRAPSSPCNAYGNAAPWARAFPQPAGDTMLADATHCDFEAPTDGWCRFFCGESEAARGQRVREALLAAVLARFEGPPIR
jgi:alpha-beta hydrolase superfamily lysophospholipase